MAHLYRQALAFFILFAICGQWIEAEEFSTKALKLPADVSYVAVDMKFSPVRGAQICEIQHGVPSTYKGERFSNGGYCLIAENLLKELGRYFDKSWVAIGAFADPSTVELLLEDKTWIKVKNFEDLTTNKKFLKNAALPVYDPSDISAYHGFAFMNPRKNDDRETFQRKYPGVLVIDNAIYKYRRNKFKMTELLMGNPVTEQHKPKWGIYKATYNEKLADNIIHDIGSNILVIKPLNGAQGDGVIIVDKEDLDDALQYVTNNKPAQPLNPDPAYQYWLSDSSGIFLVEEFIDADPIAVPHLGGNLYSPTLRLVFLLFYNKNNIDVVCLGGYYSLPKKALSEPGTLNEHYKTACEIPFYAKGDPEIMQLAEEQLKEVLTIIYQKMLGLE